MNRLGMQCHTLRYAWTRERLYAYLADGIPRAETLARTAWTSATDMAAGGGSRRCYPRWTTTGCSVAGS
jgi:hypothetical protein